MHLYYKCKKMSLIRMITYRLFKLKFFKKKESIKNKNIFQYFSNLYIVYICIKCSLSKYDLKNLYKDRKKIVNNCIIMCLTVKF